MPPARRRPRRTRCRACGMRSRRAVRAPPRRWSSDPRRLVSDCRRLRQGLGLRRGPRPAIERNAESRLPADAEDRRPTDDLLERRRRPPGPDLLDGRVGFVDVLDEPVAPPEADATDLVREAE